MFGAAFGFLSVALGAFGAHALKARLDDYSMEVYQTAANYQFLHAIVLLIVGTLAMQSTTRFLNLSGWLFIAGIIIFSSSLYGLALTQIKPLGAITPIGGILLLGAWLSLLIHFFSGHNFT